VHHGAFGKRYQIVPAVALVLVCLVRSRDLFWIAVPSECVSTSFSKTEIDPRRLLSMITNGKSPNASERIILD
jgi:hypothetical protein